MAAPPTVQAIHDTDTAVVHVPDVFTYTDAGLENLEQFVGWLNTRAGRDRFTVVTATPIRKSARGGMTRLHTEYLKGEPEVRIRAALHRLLRTWTGRLKTNPASLVRRGGSWTVPDAAEAIRLIAHDANVPFNDARRAFLDLLTAELGPVMDRVVFPPEDAVRPLADDTDRYGEQAYPVDL